MCNTPIGTTSWSLAVKWNGSKKWRIRGNDTDVSMVGEGRYEQWTTNIPHDLTSFRYNLIPWLCKFCAQEGCFWRRTGVWNSCCKFIKRDFYVDDGLKSVSTPDEALRLIDRSRALCAKYGLNLHKFLSNSKEVLKNIPLKARAKELANINLHNDKLPIERTLGIQWCIESDSFQFRITINDQPLTRRGVLSTLSSVYDPLGFIALFILIKKQILQEMCRNQPDWDSPIPENLHPRWWQWLEHVKHMESVAINRCWKPTDFGEVVVAEIHHFSYASAMGHGQC